MNVIHKMYRMRLGLLAISFLCLTRVSLEAAIKKIDFAESLPMVGDPVGELRPRNLFFQDITGMTEQAFRSQNPKARRQRVLDYFEAKHFTTGSFTTESLNSLRKLCMALPARGNGTFHVIAGHEPMSNPLVYQQVDIGAIQAHWGKSCADSGAGKLAVVVASNSNGLETTGFNDIPTNITRYTSDPTQGPAASISAATGTVLRNYWAFYDQAGDQNLWAQCDGNKQVNFLEDLVFVNPTPQDVLGLTMSNGYLRLGNLGDSLPMVANVFENHAPFIKVGVHRDVSVSHGLREGNQHRFLVNPVDRPLINQIFCAALDIGQGTNVRNVFTEKIAKVLLEAQVEASIRAAWLSGTSTLVFPLLGCGVFGNDPQWLIESFVKNKTLIQRSGMRVVLNLFSDTITVRNTVLQQLVQDTGGSVVVYSQDGNKLLVNGALFNS